MNALLKTQLRAHGSVVIASRGFDRRVWEGHLAVQTTSFEDRKHHNRGRAHRSVGQNRYGRAECSYIENARAARGAPLVCDHGRVLIPVGAGHLDERGSRSERGVTARSRRRGATHSNQLTHDHVRRAWRRRIGRSKRTSWHERAPPKEVCPITRTTILWRGYEERGAREGHRSSQRALNRTGSRPFHRARHSRHPRHSDSPKATISTSHLRCRFCTATS
jgi:hypothetical protein